MLLGKGNKGLSDSVNAGNIMSLLTFLSSNKKQDKFYYNKKYRKIKPDRHSNTIWSIKGNITSDVEM